MNESPEQLLLKFVEAYPWAATLVFWAGAARLLLKWVSGPIQRGMESALLRMAADEEGYQMVLLGLRHRAYRTLVFVLDLTCSVKLPTLASFLAHCSRTGAPADSKPQPSQPHE